MRRIQFPGRRIDAVAFFRNGQRDNRYLRLAKFFDNRRQRIEPGVQTFVHRADHNGLVAVGAFFQHGKQMVLFAKLAHQRVAAEQTDFTDPPVAADVIQHAIGEQRLVRTVKRAKAEMDNTRAELAAIVLRVLHVLR